jgi:hypothetical protein
MVSTSAKLTCDSSRCPDANAMELALFYRHAKEFLGRVIEDPSLWTDPEILRSSESFIGWELIYIVIQLAAAGYPNEVLVA